MQHEVVDERDTEWETSSPAMRAFFWTHERTHVSCEEIRGATVAEAQQWASAEAVRRGAELEFAVFSFDEMGRPGLVWLAETSGDDA